MTQKTPPLPRRSILLLAGLLLAASAGLAAYSLLYRPGAGSSGIALVGGPFTMVTHRGEPVTEQMLIGKHTLIFFGFTYCPDVCPTELQVMTAATDALARQGIMVSPVFVSIDPGRDTPEVVKSYVENFSPALIGLTGTPEQVSQMAKAYRVYYAKVENAKSPQDYLMDHSSILYLMGPDGKFLKHFTYTTDAEALAKAIGQALDN